MSSTSKDFQFELNETLYFDRGDEVFELIGISLNPEITIHTYDTYVSIRGEIELRGEYMRDTESTEEEDTHYTFDDLEAKRFVESVEGKEDNIAEFSHRFPVDISIPDYRIKNMDDIGIEVVNFDYEFPENSKLQLTAVAEIQGIKAEVELLKSEENKENNGELVREEESKSFAFEVKREENEYEEIETEQLERESEGQEDNEVEVSEDEIPSLRENLDSDEEDKEDKEEVRENELTIRAMEQPEEVSREGEEQTEESVKDASYLTDIFREEEEESYTRMKICIVQEDDTIETIAERFQISALQLIKQNNLDENFDINEGQLLYIPKK